MTYESFLAFRRSIPRPPHLDRQTVRVRGVELSVWSSPPIDGADPLLCINGGMIYGHEMLWPALSPLAARRQVILYDQRGRGRSAAPPNPFATSIEDDVADVAALRRSLGIRRWNILGHSWGGGIAARAAAADSAAVRKLVLVNAVGPTSDWMEPLRENILARLPGGPERDLVLASPDSVLGSPDPALHSAYSRAVYPAWFADRGMAAHFAPPDALSETGAAVLAQLRAGHYDWRALFGSFRVASLVLHGELDALPASTADRWLEVLPQGRKALLPASGHMPFWEEPERFFALVDAFLLPASASAAIPP